jgi:hypothetical protein
VAWTGRVRAESEASTDVLSQYVIRRSRIIIYIEYTIIRTLDVKIARSIIIES